MSQPPYNPNEPRQPYGQQPQWQGAPPAYQPPPPVPPAAKKGRGWLLPAIAGFALGSIVGCAGGIAGDATTVSTGGGATNPTVTVTQPGRTVTQAANGKPAPTVTVTETAKAPKPERPPAGTSIGDGVNQAVGDEIKPGSYRTSGGEGCYWARSSTDSGGFKDIIANGNPQGSARVKVKKGEFFTSQRCGTWERVN